MAKINNTELIQSLIDKAKINIQTDKVPTELAEKIVPVLIAGETERRIQTRGATASDSTEQAVFTTSTINDTFLIAAHLTLAKDALSNNLLSQLVITPFGDTTEGILQIRTEPLTAEQGLLADIVFPFPMKLEKGSPISISNSSATASIDTTASIFFYEVEP